MVEVSEPAAPSRTVLKKLCLRLDDGTLIRSTESGGVECLRPEEAYSKGCLTEVHLLRTQALLCEVHAKLPDEGPLRSISSVSKRSADTLIEALGGGPKKARSGANTLATASPGTPDTAFVAGATSPPSVAPPPSLPSLRDPLVSKGNALIDRVITALGGPKDAAALGFTVAVDAKLVPDYYLIVKRPINLGEVRARIKRGQYGSPVEFYNDMRLLFENCFLYNPAGTPVHRLGLHAEAVFDAEWARGPWAGLTPARTPPSPDLLVPPSLAPPKKPKARSGRAGGGNGGGGARRPAPHGGAPRPKPAPGVARTKSVNSYRTSMPLPADKQAALAAALQDESVLATKMEGVVDILQRAGELPTNEDGEVELDLGVLTPATVWALHDYVLGVSSGGAAHVAHQAAHQPQPAASGFQLAEDSEYEPDDDDDE